MNEQVNVLKPFDLTGDDPQSFAETVKWLQKHTKQQDFCTDDIKVLSYSGVKKVNGKYEVSFLSIDPLYPYVQHDDILKFDKKKFIVSKEIYEMIYESGLVFLIGSQIFVVDQKAFASIGSFLDCNGRMLYNGWIGRDLCIADALSDMEHINFIYRENDKNTVKFVIAVLGEKQAYHRIDDSVEECLNSLPKPHEAKMYKWQVKNEAFYVWEDYPKYQMEIHGVQWNFGIMIVRPDFVRQSYHFSYYARFDDVYIVVRTEKLNFDKNPKEKRKILSKGFPQDFSMFRSKLDTLLYSIDWKKQYKTAMFNGVDLVERILDQVAIKKHIGVARYQKMKTELLKQLMAKETILVYDVFIEILRAGSPYMRELNDRYKEVYMMNILKLPEILKKEFVHAKKREKTFEGQMSLFECVNR